MLRKIFQYILSWLGYNKPSKEELLELSDDRLKRLQDSGAPESLIKREQEHREKLGGKNGQSDDG